MIPTMLLVEVKRNILNKCLKINNEISRIIKINGKTNENLRLERNCDETIIEGIEFDYKELHSVYGIELLVGGSVIASINISTLFDLAGCKTNKIYFPKYLLPPVPLVSLQYHEVLFRLISEYVFDYKLILKNKYNDNEKREIMINKRIENIFNIYIAQTFMNVNQINLSQYFSNSKGFYLKTYIKPNNIKFKLNNEIISEYDYKDIIHFFGKPKILWKYSKVHNILLNKLPLHSNILEYINSFLDGTEENMYWISLLPDNRPDNFNEPHINLTTSSYCVEFNNSFSGEIINLKNNIFITQSGMGGIQFIY